MFFSTSVKEKFFLKVSKNRNGLSEVFICTKNKRKYYWEISGLAICQKTRQNAVWKKKACVKLNCSEKWIIFVKPCLQYLTSTCVRFTGAKLRLSLASPHFHIVICPSLSESILKKLSQLIEKPGQFWNLSGKSM